MSNPMDILHSHHCFRTGYFLCQGQPDPGFLSQIGCWVPQWLWQKTRRLCKIQPAYSLSHYDDDNQHVYLGFPLQILQLPGCARIVRQTKSSSICFDTSIVLFVGLINQDCREYSFGFRHSEMTSYMLLAHLWVLCGELSHISEMDRYAPFPPIIVDVFHGMKPGSGHEILSFGLTYLGTQLSVIPWDMQITLYCQYSLQTAPFWICTGDNVRQLENSSCVFIRIHFLYIHY